jgi:signal transduction histidine kinase
MVVDRSSVDVAACLSARHQCILDDYVGRLKASGNPIADRPEALAGALTQASSLLDELGDLLRADAPDEPATRDVRTERGLSRRIGEERARTRVHPRMSLMAGAELFAAVVGAVTSDLVGRPDSGEMVAGVAVAANTLLAQRIGDAADAYSSFLLGEVRRANAAERSRIARDLHDKVGHDVHLAYRQLELAVIARPTDRLRSDEAVDDASDSVRSTLESIREVITGLRVGDPLESLEKALRTVAESDLTGSVVVDVAVNGDEGWAPLEILDESYLIVREALRNALAHACARRVDVEVNIAPHELRAVIRDDGVGFDTRAPRPAGSVGAGLASLYERVAILDGATLIVSEPRRGTVVDILIPLSGLRRDDR